MPDYICAHCGGRTGMMAHYMMGLYIDGKWHSFPNQEGAQSCSPEFTRLCQRHLGDIHGFDAAFTAFRARRPEVERISRDEFRGRCDRLPS